MLSSMAQWILDTTKDTLLKEKQQPRLGLLSPRGSAFGAHRVVLKLRVGRINKVCSSVCGYDVVCQKEENELVGEVRTHCTYENIECHNF
ncbi:hypothetical protein BaRGS_00034630 [Batillaria attramentaria]|uniref:Uncharacterized protein n=1 Tax=Batillaria attramentaria TaxID=370345 RepID=A0ABD0JGQ9_9CAEN